MQANLGSVVLARYGTKVVGYNYRDRSIHTEIECLAVLLLLSLAVL